MAVQLRHSGVPWAQPPAESSHVVCTDAWALKSECSPHYITQRNGSRSCHGAAPDQQRFDKRLEQAGWHRLRCRVQHACRVEGSSITCVSLLQEPPSVWKAVSGSPRLDTALDRLPNPAHLAGSPAQCDLGAPTTPGAP